VERGAWPVPEVFRFLADAGKVSESEMFEVFNMGIGMIAVVPPDRVESVRRAAAESDVDTWTVGQVVEGTGVRIA
jgi:phosphoribosylformylglycinamidine cyclo-ligase